MSLCGGPQNLPEYKMKRGVYFQSLHRSARPVKPTVRKRRLAVLSTTKTLYTLSEDLCLNTILSENRTKMSLKRLEQKLN